MKKAYFTILIKQNLVWYFQYTIDEFLNLTTVPNGILQSWIEPPTLFNSKK